MSRIPHCRSCKGLGLFPKVGSKWDDDHLKCVACNGTGRSFESPFEPLDGTYPPDAISDPNGPWATATADEIEKAIIQTREMLRNDSGRHGWGEKTMEGPQLSPMNLDEGLRTTVRTMQSQSTLTVPVEPAIKPRHIPELFQGHTNGRTTKWSWKCSCGVDGAIENSKSLALAAVRTHVDS